MNALTLVTNFMHGENKEFYSNFKKIMELKIDDRKLQLNTSCVESIFRMENDLNIGEGLNYSSLDILQESVKQQSSIDITLKNGDSVILHPVSSQNVLHTFDRLNESNQRTLINNLFLTKSNFKSSIDFCSKIKKGQ